jgi:HD-GYP domain-containing protein (c-di-GMP phosphodiesterase class II)
MNKKYRSGKKEQKFAFDLLEAVISLQEARDFYTAFHQEKVSRIAVKIGKVMGLTETELFSIKACGLIHDVGKLTIPSSILNKPSELISEEFELLKTHTNSKYLDRFKVFSTVFPLFEVINQHHERIDGSGYPKGLTAKDICEEAKIIAVADVYDAISTDRPYRKSLGKDEAVEYISSNKNILFDSDVVDAFLKTLSKV